MLKNICAISYQLASSINSYLASNTSVKISPSAWIDIPLVASNSNQLELFRKEVKAGTIYTVEIQLIVKQEPTNAPIILNIKLDSGENLILGDKDLPVKLQFNGILTTLQANTSHNSWRKPLSLIP